MHFEKSRVKISQNHTSNLDEVFLKLLLSSDFGLEPRILQIGWFYRPKCKKVEKLALKKNKHPIKRRFFIWRLQSANPEKSNSGKLRIWIMFFSKSGKRSEDFMWSFFGGVEVSQTTLWYNTSHRKSFQKVHLWENLLVYYRTIVKSNSSPVWVLSTFSFFPKGKPLKNMQHCFSKSLR